MGTWIATGIVMVCLMGHVMFNHVVYGEEYLTSFLKDEKTAAIFAYTRSPTDWVRLQTLPQLRRYMNHLTQINVPISLRTTEGIENKSLAVRTSDGNFTVSGGYDQILFSLLPISALGPKYKVSSCHPNVPSVISVLVIGTHRQKTSVDITFRLQGNIVYEGRMYRNGDTLSLSLEEYETFTIKSSFDLSGTVIRATQTVAVFSGTMVSNITVAYEQLLPIKHYGQEFIVAVDDNPYLYKLQIVSEQSDTQIMFKNGSTRSLGASGIYSQTLTRNGSLHFSSTRPVMTTLCRSNGINSGFAVVPHVMLYVKQTAFHWFNKFKVLTDKDADRIKVTNENSLSILGQWKEIPGSIYKVGTWTGSGYTSVTATTTFTVLVFKDQSIYNGGYNFSTPHIACDRDHYGLDCSRVCTSRHCKGSSSCAPPLGQCDGGCQPGWSWVDCTVCAVGHYGPDCIACASRHCEGVSSCSPLSGQCDRGCQTRWVGTDCRECDNHYGDNCSFPCTKRHCFGISSCNHVTGSCDNGCDPGWKGQDCSEGKALEISDACNPTAGQCGGGCQNVVKTPEITHECDNHYGDNCSFPCTKRHCFGISSCNHVTGSCDNGCDPGWKGQDCSEVCDREYYGANCSKLCSTRHCDGGSACNATTGQCDGGCQARWMGTDCTECDNHYGDNCSFPCTRRHCFGISSCNHVTGSCDNGCDPGWKGQDCSEVCDREYYGANCSKLCSTRHCDGGSACNAATGQCDGGCQARWMGTDCTDPSTQTTTVIVAVTTTCVLVIVLAVLVGIVVWRKRSQRNGKTVSNQVIFRDSTASITNAIGNEYEVPDRQKVSDGYVNAEEEYTEINYNEDRSHKNSLEEVSNRAADVPPHDSIPTYENFMTGGQNVYENLNRMG